MAETQTDTGAKTSPDEMPHILVIDDDERLRTLLYRYLGSNGFLVSTAVDATDARAKLQSLVYDLLVLDVMMPGESGFELTRALKDEGSTLPILLLTAKGETEARIEGLEAGADDYLSKPFEPRELLLRINAILRRAERSSEAKDKKPRFGRWIYDPARSQLTDGDESVGLTTMEATLLDALLQKKGEIVSRDELAETGGISGNERTIDVQVTRLRKKIESDPKNPRFLQTVRGKGYMLRPDDL